MSEITDKDMGFDFAVFIDRPVEQVYEAVADPAQLSKYFTTNGAKGRLETGATATWDFADFPGPFPVRVIRAEKPGLIEFAWPSDIEGADETRVTFRFEDQDGRTRVSVAETGWPATPAGLKAALGNAYGWAHMLAALKAWLDHGIVLRQGMFR
ncbi:SRPBCC domain-containing protein [Paracoccus pacificus]|uniref:SRPBCC domain-containing protein n=1 Tax=Paracoccus pacificus TaxID=1463598 RepID=A0ABW4RD53_9RHOB